MLEEVIVTAEKKVESLSGIAMTVNAISGEQLADHASFELTDLEKLTSGFAINGQGFSCRCPYQSVPQSQYGTCGRLDAQ